MVKKSGFMHFVMVVTATVLALLARPAAAQYYAYPYLEAECPDTSSGGYVNKQTSITGFSGSGYLRSAANTTPASYNNTSNDHAKFQFEIRHYWTYQVWFRINTNNSTNDDSFFFQIDPTHYPDWTTINNVNASGWQWVSGGSYQLGVGQTTLEIANREDGLNIDKIAILPYGQTPTGAGEQAYNCPVAMYFESECRTGAFNTYQRDKVAKTGFSGTGYIESATTSTTVDPRIDEATYFFETGSAAYNLFFRINNNGNASNDSWFYQVDNGSWVTMNNTNGLGTGWRWAQGTASVTLSHARHTLRIRNRESGLSIDKLAFVPTSVAGPSGTGLGNAAVNCEPFKLMSDWKPGEIYQFYNTHLNYFSAQPMDPQYVSAGEEMLMHHSMWHDANGQGGQAGTGSGVAFLGYHRAMMNDMRRFALETNGRSWLPINTVGPAIPSGSPYAQLEDSYQALMASNMLDQYEARTDSVVMDFGIPGYLTIAGTVSAKWPSNLGYDKLGDIDTLDKLGLAIGFSYHGAFHQAVGGTMSTARISPSDPIFYGWHGLIDRIASDWLTTTKGKAWAAANPNHPFLVDGFTNMEGWNNTDWD